jgi:hypothetical protein
MRPLLVLAQYFVLDFDSLAEDLVVELRNRHIELDLILQLFHQLSSQTYKKGAIGREQVGSQEHHQETKRYGLYPGSANQPKSGNAKRH